MVGKFVLLYRSKLLSRKESKFEMISKTRDLNARGVLGTDIVNYLAT